MKLNAWLAIFLSLWMTLSYASDQNMFTAPMTFNGRLKILNTGPDSLAARALIIREAQKTIDVTTFFWANDPSAAVLNLELIAAAQRGVKVRLLADALWSFKFNRKDLDWLILQGQGNISVGLFGTPLASESDMMSRLSTGFHWARRLHDKIFLVDALESKSYLITGGRNIDNEQLGGTSDGNSRFRDLDILVLGNSGQNSLGVVLDYFNNLASRKTTRWVKPLSEFKDVLPQGKSIIQFSEQVTSRPFYRYTEFTTNNPEFLTSGFAEGTFTLKHELQNQIRQTGSMNMEDTNLPDYLIGNENSLMQSLRNKMMAARKSISLVSPSFYLTPNETRNLLVWLSIDSNRLVRIITNSIAATGLLWTTAITDEVFLKNLESQPLYPVVASQIQIHQFSRLDTLPKDPKELPQTMHAKYAIIDSKETLIGSSNFDPLSRYHASESGFWIESQDFAMTMDQHFNALVRASHAWKSDEWTMIRKLNEKKVKKAKLIYNILDWVGLEDRT